MKFFFKKVSDQNIHGVDTLLNFSSVPLVLGTKNILSFFLPKEIKYRNRPILIFCARSFLPSIFSGFSESARKSSGAVGDSDRFATPQHRRLPPTKPGIICPLEAC